MPKYTLTRCKTVALGLEILSECMKPEKSLMIKPRKKKGRETANIKTAFPTPALFLKKERKFGSKGT